MTPKYILSEECELRVKITYTEKRQGSMSKIDVSMPGQLECPLPHGALGRLPTATCSNNTSSEASFKN
jgi:hypothetical protein